MVVGLHHHGFAIDVKTCQYSDDLNKAVRIEKIIERLEEWSKGTDDRAATARAIRERLSIE
jgi:hypothetical protein